MGRPIALDIFCGAGGASLGLKQAGFYVVGIDIKRPTNYLGDEFIQGDIHNLPIKDLLYFSLIWTSPPCQAFSCSSGRWKEIKDYPNLIPITRATIADHPYTVIENVPQAPIRPNLTLYGPQVGLGPKETITAFETKKRDGLWRKRTFELSFFAWNPPKPTMDRSGCYASIAGHMGCKGTFHRRKAKGLPGSLSMKEGLEVMGYPEGTEISRKELVESVPPAYSKYIGLEALARMQETGYISGQEQAARKRAGETLKWMQSLDEPPFFKPKKKKETTYYSWSVYIGRSIKSLLKQTSPIDSGTIEADTLEKAKRRATKICGVDFKKIGNYSYGNCPWQQWDEQIFYRCQSDRHALKEEAKTLIIQKKGNQ